MTVEEFNHLLPYEQIEFLSDYENVKDRLIPKLINADVFKEEPERACLKKIGDMAVTLMYYAGIENDTAVYSKITESMVEAYKVKPDALLSHAIDNLCKPKFIDVYKSIEFKDYSAVELSPESIGGRIPLYVLTNDNENLLNVNAATQILNPAVRDKIADKLGDSWVIPSSVHEILVLPKSAFWGGEKDIKEMILSVNSDRDIVKKEDVLSDNVYEITEHNHDLRPAKTEKHSFRH